MGVALLGIIVVQIAWFARLVAGRPGTAST
jgi:hypothetical protein